jgi:glycosyltransferase involved in cell wall biosynthesis
MKILYHHRTRSRDGQAVHIEELVAALRGLGHEVIMVAPPGTERAEFGDEGGAVAMLKRLLPHVVYELLEMGYSWVAWRRLRRAYLEHRPDVLYERYNLFLVAGAWLKQRYGLPLLLEVNAPLAAERKEYDGLGLEGLARWSERSTWAAADRVLAVTDELRKMIAAEGVPAAKIVVIPNGVDQAKFTATLSAEEAKRRLGLAGATVLGFTGFVRSWHGLERVVDIIAENGGAGDLRLLVVGDGPARPEIEARAAAKGVGDRVIFTGIVDRERVASHVAAFDVALQPAIVSYASPLKLFEYMALGRAIVAPRQPNIEEVLLDGENAILFDPEERGAFEAAIRRLLADPALRSSLGAGAAASIDRQGLTWRRNAERVVALFEELSAGK